MLAEDLWTVERVAQYLQLKPNTVRQYVISGKIPYLKIGVNVRFDPVVIREWANSHRRPHGTTHAFGVAATPTP